MGSLRVCKYLLESQDMSLAATKPKILDLSYEELRELMASFGEPEFRASQVMGWLYGRLVNSFGEMTDLPQSLREKLEREAEISVLKPLEERASADGMTGKTLFGLSDGETIESSYMVYAPAGENRERTTVCISSQVGCSAGCPFCATGKQGFSRNLTTGEIVGQVLHFMRRLGGDRTPGKRRPVTNVVFMGMGEPLANYDSVVKAVTLMNSKRGLAISARQITVSTSGLAPQLRRLASEKVRVELAVSLHAPNNKLRDFLVPINRRYPLEELLPACRYFFKQTGRRITFEYVLFRGLNDSPECARELAVLLRGLNSHVNLIIGNPTGRGEFRAVTPSQARAFQQVLTAGGINSTIREPRGVDIEAGCGELRSRHLEAVGGRED